MSVTEYYEYYRELARNRNEIKLFITLLIRTSLVFSITPYNNTRKDENFF